MQIVIRPALPSDAEYIARNLREADFIELKVSRYGADPYYTVIESVVCSDWCEVAEVDGVPTVVYGLSATHDRDAGIPWMVATTDIKKIKKEFVKGSKRIVECMDSYFPKLFNMVHIDNHLSIRWLNWLGFTVVKTPMGPHNAFYYFWRGSENV